MEELTHDFLSFLPAALLALAAAGAPEVYKLAARRFLDRAKSHTASWLYILLDSFLTPVAGLFRVLLGAAAVKSLPFELVRDAVFLQYLNLAADLLVIKSALISNERVQVPAWLEVDIEKLQGSVLALPQRDQIDLDIREQLIVELYSK